MAEFPAPVGGASLVLSFRLPSRTILIVGSDPLAAARAFSALEADATVIVLAKGGLDSACEELKWRARQKQLVLLDLDALPGPSTSSDPLERDVDAFDAYLSTLGAVNLVCVTDTLLGADSITRRSRHSAAGIARVCRKRNIPVNVTDMPDLCDFSFTSTHRFSDSKTGTATSLQIGVTTNGQGCRLAGRLRRDIVSKLPKDVGDAVVRVGKLRELAKRANGAQAEDGIDLNEEDSTPTPNQPVAQRAGRETAAESARRRMKWVAQVSEYWPISRLATMTEDDMTNVLDGGEGSDSLANSSRRPSLQSLQSHPGDSEVDSLHGLTLSPSPPSHGRILLVGSGPGHPSLLTIATHSALTKHADLVLSDKLVPAEVLALIPSNVEVRIARKFPGNADGAQNELMEAAVEAANRGLTVVRLKQGDPTVYGRAGEEVLYFRAHGFEPVVIPGVSSALAGPVFAGIPVTQRGAAESFIVCTGVGRQGREVKLPGYERSRTLVILMGVARLPQVLETLQANVPSCNQGEPNHSSRRSGPAYPSHTPIALIERASMPDQRAIFSTLQDIVPALESVGEQRPPGMLVVGWSVLSLWNTGDMSVLDEEAAEKDEERIIAWLEGARWRVIEGLDRSWEDL